MGDKNYDNGYLHGNEDAKSGNGKSTFVRPLKRALKPDSFLPGGKNRVETYIGAYSTGFEDGVRVINTAPQQNSLIENKPVTKQGSTMSQSNTLEHQLELLHELDTYLKSVQDQMDSIRAEYGRRVNELRDAGMIVNHHDYLQRNIFNPTESAILKFVEHLQIRDLTTVRKEIGYVEIEIDRLKSYDD